MLALTPAISQHVTSDATDISSQSTLDSPAEISAEQYWTPSVSDEYTEYVLPEGPFKQCQNQLDHGSCNFLLAADDTENYCLSCRQTKTTPDLSKPSNLSSWITIENAKRRLFYTLAKLGLEDESRHPEYDFLEDVEGEDPVLTGHANGLITINIAEADDAERTRRRVDLHEPYRTLLGHFRHEAGHFYWDLFFLNDPEALEAYRTIFGDETADYGEALKQHYNAPVADWQQHFISSYASAHPWEDWAETWAHYLHLIDMTETAANFQLEMTTKGRMGLSHIKLQDPYLLPPPVVSDLTQIDQTIIDTLLSQSMAVSQMLNSLNRSLGQNDAYPFTFSTPVLQKLAFVHQVVHRFASQRLSETTASTVTTTPEQNASSSAEVLE